MSAPFNRRAAAKQVAIALRATQEAFATVVSVLSHANSVETMANSAAELRKNQPGFFEPRNKR